MKLLVFPKRGAIYRLRLRRQAATPIPAKPAAITATMLGSGVTAGKPESTAAENPKKQKPNNTAVTRINLIGAILRTEHISTELKGTREF